MAALDFPGSPTTGDVYTGNGHSWQWNGESWIGIATVPGAPYGPVNAQYLTLALNASLTAERVLTPGVGLIGTDAGANSTYTLDCDISGSTPVVAPSWADKTIRWAQPNGGSNNFSSYGLDHTIYSAYNQITGGGGSTSGSFYNQQNKMLLANVTSGSGNGSGWRTINYFTRGSVSGVGGFYVQVRWAYDSVSIATRGMVGLINVSGLSTEAFAFTVEPSTAVNCLFYGHDSTDTNWQVMHNDGSGTCTKVDLGASFSVAAQEVLFGAFFCDPNASTIDYYIINKSTGATASGTLGSNLPSNTVFLAGVMQRATAASGQPTWSPLRFYSETPGY